MPRFHPLPFAAALTLAACSPEPARLDHPDLVLVSIDTLRADLMGCYGYFRDTTPTIDRFASQAILFERCYATMATTLPSHASMFTARYPLEHGVVGNIAHGGRLFGWKEELLSFAQVAKDEGYVTAGFVGGAPLKAATGISLGFDHWDQPEGRERKAEEVMDAVLPWLEEHAGERLFLFVHFYDPHWKHRAPEPFGSMFETDARLDEWLAERGIGDSAVRSQGIKISDTRKLVNGYCGEVRYVDGQVERLFTGLRDLGRWDDAVVIVTSDHGESLNQHDWASHGLVWEEQLRVPLLIRFPGLRRAYPQKFTPLMSSIDLLPTVMARMTDFRTPLARRFLEQATGVDVLDREFEPRPVFSQRTMREMADDPGPMYAVTGIDWKFVHYEEEDADYLFDREADPHELQNLAEVRPKMAQMAREKLMALMLVQGQRGELLGSSEPEAELDPALLRELQELGYMGGVQADEEEELP